MSTLWRRIQRHIYSGKETPKVDFKLLLDLSTKRSKAEFAKDVMAIANTPGGDGYLIIGLDNVGENPAASSLDRVVGFQAERGADQFHIQMIDALSDFCTRVPAVEYDELLVPDSNKMIGVVTIKRSDKRPHSFSKDCESGKQNQIPIRRGTKTFPQASVDEIQGMMAQTKGYEPTIVISLSGHPLSDRQMVQLEKQVYIEELIEIFPHFAPPPLLPQIEDLVKKIGLSNEEWQSCSIVVIPPGLALPAITLIAYLHGLRGGFIRVGWVRPDADDKSIYNIDELIPLQEIRDNIRSRRNEF